jgi:hypothetical protein
LESFVRRGRGVGRREGCGPWRPLWVGRCGDPFLWMDAEGARCREQGALSTERGAGCEDVQEAQVGAARDDSVALLCGGTGEFRCATQGVLSRLPWLIT